MKNTLKKSERLSKKKQIDDLFLIGKSFQIHPLRCQWKWNEAQANDASVQVLFSAPKRRFKKAHDRNRIKRMMRESYRLNKEVLHPTTIDKTLCVAFLWNSSEMPNFKEVQDKIILTLLRLKNITKDPESPILN